MRFVTHYSGSSGNLYHVLGRGSELLIDPGVPIRRIKHALGFKTGKIDAALISHYHRDHCAGVAELLRAGIACYMTTETAQALRINHHRLRIITPLEPVVFGAWKVVAFPTQHDTPGSVGFFVSDGHERLLYITDSYYVYHRFAGANIIAVECNYSRDTLTPDLDPARKKRLYSSHFSLENVKKFLAANDLSQVREIHLIHISKDNGDPAIFKNEIQASTGIPVRVQKL